MIYNSKNILIKNIYYMLTYAFKNLTQNTFESVAAEDFENIHNLFAAILSKGIAVQLKQGLCREYINKTETLSVLHGKINISETIKNKSCKNQVLTCDFDELSENNILNQILKTTAFLLIKNKNVSIAYKSELKKEMLFFSDVDEIDPVSVKWSALYFNRNNQNYRMLITICQLIIKGMLLSTEKGEYKLASFVDEKNLCLLYEKFILEYFRREYPGLKAEASQIEWSVDDGYRTLLPSMQSDITLSDGKNILIIDAKFYSSVMQKNYNKESIRSAHLYQIFAYVKNTVSNNLKKNCFSPVSGMLLYAKTDEALLPDNVYHISGNKISVKTLDLNKDFSEIKAQLNKIEEEHFKH